MVKLPLRAGAVDRSVWPIAAPLARVAELLRVDVTDAAERVAPYITADGRRLWSVKRSSGPSTRTPQDGYDAGQAHPRRHLPA
jgi:hypothetical protein